VFVLRIEIASPLRLLLLLYLLHPKPWSPQHMWLLRVDHFLKLDVKRELG
jgi:hypothetical protein